MIFNSFGFFLFIIVLFVIYWATKDEYKKYEKSPELDELTKIVNKPRETVEDILIPKSLRLYGSSDSMSLSIFGMVKGMVMPLLVFPSIFLASFSTLIIPEIAEANALNKKNTVNYIISKVIKFTLLIAIFSTGIFIVFSQELAVGLYKSEDVGYLLRILAPLIPFMYLDKIVDGSLNALDLQITTLKYNIIDMFVRITSITLLIPRYGIKGFVLVLFISTTFNTSLGVIKILKETKLKYDILDWILKPTISITLSSYATKIILYCLHINNAVFISIILDLLIYFAMLILFKAITKKDIQWFANGFKKDIKKGKYRPVYYNGTLYNHPTGRTFYGIFENHKNIERKKTVVIFEGKR